MPGDRDLPPLVPQRVVVAGEPGEALTGFLQRLADVLDVPLVPVAELAGPAEVARLAAFEGWVTTAEHDSARAVLLPRAQVVVHHDVPPPTTLTGLVRRTLRRVRSAPGPDAAWLASVSTEHPDVAVVRLTRAAQAEEWLQSLIR